MLSPHATFFVGFDFHTVESTKWCDVLSSRLALARLGTAHDLGYQSKVASGLLEHKVTTVTTADGSERITEQVRVTPKGVTRLAELIKPALGKVA